MEKRIGSVLILVREKSLTHVINSTISKFSHIIIGRQGLPVQSENSAIISLVLEGSTDEIGSLTGQLGRIQGISLKSVVLKIQDL
jgi:putative iron-only hydrogenase system regulator